MKRLYIFIKFCFFFAILIAIAGAGTGLYFYQKFSKDLPKLDSLRDYNPPVVSEVYADDGSKIGEFWLERRIVLSQQEIPKLIEQAIISGEDSSFFDHSGIDYMGIVRAMIENLRAGHIVQGGSTITQQVVKSFFLSGEKKLSRKIKEAILARRLEQNFSKQEILYLYLNQIYLGNRAYGIEAAAQNYFKKTAKELNIAQAAMIAGLAKAPSRYNPISNFKRAKKRQEYVIERLYENGYITKDQMTQAIRESLKFYVAPTDKEYNMQYAPWFVEEIRRQIIEKYGDMVPYTQGLKIYTTVDLKADHAAQKAVLRGLSELHKRHGYSGPVKHLPSSEFAKFNFENQKNLFHRGLEQGLFLPDLTDKMIETAKLTLDPEKVYQALVTAVDGKEKTISVQIGTNISGTIIARDYGWARKRNNAASGYDGVLYINTPINTFAVGDVIEVKTIELDKVDAKNKKLYSEEKSYFSLEQTPKAEAALFSYDPHSGYVKAIIGGKDYSQSEFNRAMQATRQTGSAFKALLYASAIDKGYSPDTIIQDAPISIPDGPGRVWTPHNYGGGYKGPMSFRSALIQSRNVVSVRIVLDVGVEYVTALIRKLGVTTPFAKVYSMALGANDMRPYELAHAFGVFPTGGILPELIYIKKMTNRFGSILEENHPKVVKNFVDQIKDGDYDPSNVAPKDFSEQGIEESLRKDLWTEAQTWIKKDHLMLTPFEKVILYGKYLPDGYVMNPRTIYTMVGIMQDIVNHGTGYKVHELGRPAAGKTGTTNDLTDCWFSGYTPDLVATVWTGYDSVTTKVGGGETGGKSAAPIFLYYMQKYLEGTPIAQFEVPNLPQLADMKAPVEIGPSNVSNLFNSGGGSGGADFFANDGNI